MREESFLQLITLTFGAKLITREQHIAVMIIDEVRRFPQAVLLRYVL